MESFSNAIELEASGNAPVTESAPTLAAATEKVFKGVQRCSSVFKCVQVVGGGVGVEQWWSSGEK